MFFSELNYLDDKVSSYACPSCSGNGACGNYNYCVCNQSFTLPDCSMSLADFQSILNSKKDLLTLMNQTLLLNSTKYNKDYSLLMIDNIAKSFTFNDNITLGFAADILDYTVQVYSP